jgi:dolichyl-phosphate beta-glucosyltransferase
LDALSIVIPAYNEESRLPATLDRILAWVETGAMGIREILIVDDGSSDRTAAVAEEFADRYATVRLIRNIGNRGKGYAVRNGMLKAQGEWILYTDADLSAPIEEATTLYTAALAQDAVVAIGSRALNRALVEVHQSPFREYSGRFFNVMMRMVTGLPFHDTQCGFKLYRADAAQAIFPRQQLDGFSFDVEDLYIAARLGLKTIEVPVRWSNVEGTKVSLQQGIKSFTDLARIRMRGDT